MSNDDRVPCPYCKDEEGHGQIFKSRTMHESAGLIPCPRCGGDGKVKRKSLREAEKKD